MELTAGYSIFIDENCWRAIRCKRWQLKTGDTILELGMDGKRYDTLSWELITGDTIIRGGKKWMAIRCTEMRIDYRRYDIKDVN